MDSLILSHLDEVGQPDIVPELADLLLRMEGKTWSLCTGYYGDRLYLSIRTTNPRADAGALMRRLIGRRGKGGGHGRTAGGWIDAARLSAAGERARLQTAIAAKLAVELRKKPDKMTRLALRPAGKEAPSVEVEPAAAMTAEGAPAPPPPPIASSAAAPAAEDPKPAAAASALGSDGSG